MCNCIKSAAPFKAKCFCLNRAKSALLAAFQISLYLFTFLCYTVYKVIYYGNARAGFFISGMLRAQGVHAFCKSSRLSCFRYVRDFAYVRRLPLW